jgi:hypothetical protein
MAGEHSLSVTLLLHLCEPPKGPSQQNPGRAVNTLCNNRPALLLAPHPMPPLPVGLSPAGETVAPVAGQVAQALLPVPKADSLLCQTPARVPVPLHLPYPLPIAARFIDAVRVLRYIAYSGFDIQTR